MACLLANALIARYNALHDAQLLQDCLFVMWPYNKSQNRSKASQPSLDDFLGDSPCRILAK